MDMVKNRRKHCDERAKLMSDTEEKFCFELIAAINQAGIDYDNAVAKMKAWQEGAGKTIHEVARGAFAAVRAHLEDRCPKGMKLAFEDVVEGMAAFRLPLASPLFRLAADVLTEMDARGPAFQWCGASIPVLSVLREASGAAPLIVGWGQAEDHIHSPNESYSIAQFDKAREWAKKILAAL